MVKKNRIMTLVLAAAVLAVITSGTASAYSWSGIDQSRINSNYAISFESTCTGTPSVPAGQQVSFVNNLFNNAPDALYPSVNWADSVGQTNNIPRSTSISANGGFWGTDPIYVTSPSALQGKTDRVTVYHWYTSTYGGDGPHSSVSQSFTVA